MNRNENVASNNETERQWRIGVLLLSAAVAMLILKFIQIIALLPDVQASDRWHAYLVLGFWSIGCVLLAAMGLNKMNASWFKKVMTTRTYLLTVYALAFVALATIVACVCG